ncbi:LacI family DNA-binding transcriptional regulator [Caballeronia sp. LP006]|jgi:LacI family transcriptional regulator|uniref:LacI family DNA-binding transcriptional regulator n=1 Tax=unclassified Caballeronia TaxID=2646786 RepID=UPI001FD50E7B|nr:MULTISPECIES: LacI family DNA-binding transcriptional regulator [unclassified Caballeronia]MDR5773983.1 LacI family DNA-binding transcriptional regulator [Caballeronia sp. LZ002]MDR5800343.1 LacI family DNA-binding transcriptional regulator [Caballeronia sp. LZ001]MDR5827545.1 LacI family DNA-binding transcriptional regulator [Caballeronia sp. LP006]MDR5849418.1 LacI family DNA-binding transcriptional regulator [Caballeronia sp. LZ003]
MKKTTQRRPTMTDIAKLTGVSQSTVSLVLNNASGAKFSDATRDKVLRAAHELGYRMTQREPLSFAPLDTAERNLIVYLADEISTSPHPVVSIDGARDAAFAHGRMLAVYSTHGNAEIEARVLDATLGNPDVLGVIYATVYTRRVTVPAALEQVPTVLLNCYASEANVSSVVPAEVAGGHTATDHLLAAGHRRIGYINGEPWQDAARDRLKGYRTALATADLPFAPELVREGDWGPATGFEQTLSLMREANPPTAIFCANDLMALGAIEALKQLGLRVPDDVSVLGYDDQEIARHTHPPLSSVVLPNYDLGRWAVETLLQEEHNRAAGAPVRRRTVKLDGPLIERGSVREITEAKQLAINNISDDES